MTFCAELCLHVVVTRPALRPGSTLGGWEVRDALGGERDGCPPHPLLLTRTLLKVVWGSPNGD